MSTAFITLEELAVICGDAPASAEWYFDLLSNLDSPALRPYVPAGGALKAVSPARLAWDWHGRQEAVRVRREDALAYAAGQAAEAEAARYTTWECFTYRLDDDRDRDDRSHPVYAADGSPAFEKFSRTCHAESWLARGGSLSAAPPNVKALLGKTRG